MYGAIIIHPDMTEVLAKATKPSNSFKDSHLPGLWPYVPGVPVLTCEHIEKGIAEFHNTTKSAILRIEALEKAAAEKAGRFTAYNNAQPGNFALKFIYWIGAKLRAFFCSVKKLWSVAKVR